MSTNPGLEVAHLLLDLFILTHEHVSVAPLINRIYFLLLLLQSCLQILDLSFHMGNPLIVDDVLRPVSLVALVLVERILELLQLDVSGDLVLNSRY